MFGHDHEGIKERDLVKSRDEWYDMVDLPGENFGAAFAGAGVVAAIDDNWH
jgi:hypothetical protein